MKELPIKKGKYKGKCRKVSVPNGTLQRIMDYIYLIESTWPEMAHDNLFVSLIDGSKLSDSYFDKYTEKVISKSIYKDQLIGLSNQSFRHRFITLKIVEKLNQFKNTSNLANCLAIAKKAVRKLTMHANDSTMSHYVHLALEYISEEQQLSSNVAAPERLALISIKETMNKYNHDKCSADQALSSINNAMEKIHIAA